jgi:hypothetical protein
MSEYPPQPPSPSFPPQHQTFVVQQGEAPGATAGLVLGICSIVFSGPIIGLVLGFIGYIKSRDAKALCAANPGFYSNAGTAQAGYVCSIIGMCISGLSSCCICGYFGLVAMALMGGAASGP